MVQSISISLSHTELTELIGLAVAAALDKRMKPAPDDELFTDKEATQYMKCSSVFLWKKRKQGAIVAVHAGKKILYPKSSLDNFLRLKIAR
jgi:hypothetical protein